MPSDGKKTVKARAKGYYRGPREPGDVFEIPAGLQGSWFSEVVKDAPKPDKVLTDADLA